MGEARLPSDFLWGFATASYQVEGGAKEDGRADSIWDTFCRIDGKIADSTDGDIACDSYHKYKEDVALLKELGAKAYRFSISWSRVIPLGGRNDPVNAKGLQYYKDLVDEVVTAGIEPMVTLFHWDLPQALYDSYGGFLNQTEYVQDYVNFARIMFEALGSKVKFWVTYNEPWCSAILGYSLGVFAPGHTSDRSKGSKGDSSREPWIVGHNILVAHGAAVKLYRETFKPSQGGMIGITLNGDWAEPFDAASANDVQACERRREFAIAWFADPIYRGDYPSSMRAQLGDRLPHWTEEERALVHGSNDFYGMNHYTADYVQHLDSAPTPEDFLGNVALSKTNAAGVPIGPETQCAWLRPYPPGMRKLIAWISQRYGRPIIYVTENGTSVKGESDLPLAAILQDDFRVQYYEGYLQALAEAYSFDDVDVSGYMAWSLMDNFEWAEGFNTRFGVIHVDFANGQKRTKKQSANAVGRIIQELCSR